MQYQLIPNNLNPGAKGCDISIVCDTKLLQVRWGLKENYPQELNSITIGDKLRITKNGTYCVELVGATQKIKTEFTIFHLNTPKGFAGGNGSSEAPYLITCCADFNLIRLNLNAHYQLISNLDFGKEMGDLCWLPIGTYSQKEPKHSEYSVLDSQNIDHIVDFGFIGCLDGNGHKISGLKCENSKSKYIGLFGSCGPNSYIHDLLIENCFFSGCQALAIGSIAGYAYGAKIEHCVVRDGTIFTQLIGGGIIGECNGSTRIKCCQFVGKLSGKGIDGSESYLGGIIGCIHEKKTNMSQIENCCVKTQITNCAYGGGILSGNGAIISKCFFSGIIHAKRYAAGVVAPGRFCIVEKCVCGPAEICYASNRPPSYIDSAWVTLFDKITHDFKSVFQNNVWLNHAGRIVCDDYELVPQQKFVNYAAHDCKLVSLEGEHAFIDGSLRDGITILTHELCDVSFYAKISWDFDVHWELRKDHFPQIKFLSCEN